MRDILKPGPLKDPFETRDAPMVCKVYGASGKSDRQRRFYDRYNAVLNTEARLKDLPDDEQAEAVEGIRGGMKLINVTKATRRQLSKLKRIKKKAEAADDIEALKKLEDDKMEAMEEWLDTYNEIMFGKDLPR